MDSSPALAPEWAVWSRFLLYKPRPQTFPRDKTNSLEKHIVSSQDVTASPVARLPQTTENILTSGD